MWKPLFLTASHRRNSSCFDLTKAFFVVVALTILSLMSSQASAYRAALIVDEAGRVLHAENPQLPNRPASLTKMMTAYLVFEKVKAGSLKFDAKLTVSKAAAAQPPTRIGLKADSSHSIQTLLQALIARSANDAAVVLAEGVAESESAFVGQMNAKAAALGLSATRFQSATGLPRTGQVTTARDMAVLSIALRRDFPEYFKLFSTSRFNLGSRRHSTINNFLVSYPGADGLKTGFTCKAGYNLAASVVKGGARFYGVVLGSPRAGSRDSAMSRLMSKAISERGAEGKNAKLGELAGAKGALNGKTLARTCIEGPSASRYYTASGWSVEIAIDGDKQRALRRAREFIMQYRKALRGGRPMLIPWLARGVVYRAGVTGLKKSAAGKACLEARHDGVHCLVRTPKAMQLTFKKVKSWPVWKQNETLRREVGIRVR